MSLTRRRALKSLMGGLTVSLFRAPLAFTEGTSSFDAAPEWAGEGKYRLLVKVDAVDIGRRAQVEMPAEIIIDLSAKLQELGTNVMANLASVQVMRYDCASGRPLLYDHYAYGRSRYGTELSFIRTKVQTATGDSCTRDFSKPTAKF